MAREFGATDIIEARGEEATRTVLDLTAGIGVDAALECVGTAQSITTAFAVARPGSTVGIVGVPHGQVPSTWPRDQFERIGGSEELQLASRRADGSLRPYVAMWVVRAGADLYVRSAYGPDNPWYRRAAASGGGGSGPTVSNETSPPPRPPLRPGATSTPPTTPSTTATARASSAP